MWPKLIAICRSLLSTCISLGSANCACVVFEWLLSLLADLKTRTPIIFVQLISLRQLTFYWEPTWIGVSIYKTSRHLTMSFLERRLTVFLIFLSMKVCLGTTHFPTRFLGNLRYFPGLVRLTDVWGDVLICRSECRNDQHTHISRQCMLSPHFWGFQATLRMTSSRRYIYQRRKYPSVETTEEVHIEYKT